MSASARRGGDRPVITIDMDGVICAPPLGVNLGISRRFLDPGAQPAPARVPPRWLGAPLDGLRFSFRRPLDEAREALAMLGEVRTVVVLTGRRSSPERWLRQHGLLALIDRVVVNDTALRSAHYKLRCVEELGAREHIDDDGRTAQLLAERAGARVFLRDWPRNRGPRYHPRVERVPDLLAAARMVAAD